MSLSYSEDFAQALTEKFSKSDKSQHFVRMEVDPGRRYDRIVVVKPAFHEGKPERRSHVYAFVDRSTGDLYKAASWKVPAKGKRYNGSELMDLAVEDADFYGSFLYKR